MNGRFFLDTNIFVYSFDRKAPAKARGSLELVQRAVETRKGVVSYQVVQEFFNVAFRRFAKPMTAADAEQFLGTVFRPLMSALSSPGLFGEAFRLWNRFGSSWCDSLIIAGALQGQCNVLYSEDFLSGKCFGELEIKNPFA